MRRLLVFVAAGFLSIRSGYPASITVAADGNSEHPALILIKGTLTWDQRATLIARFMLVAKQNHRAAVFLDSPGGDLRLAIAIGRLIRQYEFSTVVAENAKCQSACALIWLGGTERYLGINTKLGFHAMKNGDGTTSSFGNAIVGAYLYQMGIKNDAAITYLTSAPPTSMTWVNLAGARDYNIDAKPFSFAEDRWQWASEEIGRRRIKDIDPPIGTGTAITKQ